MDLLNPSDYINQVTASVDLATKRISIVSLVITDDAITNLLIDALAAAARRGVSVKVAGDMFTYTELNGNFIPTHYHGKKVRQTTRMAKELSRAGVTFQWLGRLNLASFSGRTHGKWCVIDDTVFSFGGVNLYGAATLNADYMLRSNNPSLADALILEHARIVQADKKHSSFRSHTLKLDASSTVLFDGGLLGDSIIYRRACRLAQDSTHITLVSQYCPTGRLAKLLRQAGATLYFNDGSRASPINRGIIRFGMKFTRLNTSYRRQPYIHGKCIVFTLRSGQKVTLSGSHNFVRGGTYLGTREIALETADPKTVAQIENFIVGQIA